MNFEIAAERLMAATTLNRKGEMGIDWPEWKERYLDDPAFEQEKVAIMAWLKRFYAEAVKDAEQERANAEVEKILQDLERAKNHP
jgi:hypothetical protein